MRAALDRFGDLPGAGLLVGPVAVDCGVSVGFGELVSSLAQDDVDAGVGRPDEGREKFRRGDGSAPIGRRQKVTSTFCSVSGFSKASTRTRISARPEAVRLARTPPEAALERREGFADLDAGDIEAFGTVIAGLQHQLRAA
jgi:hypothetical protein